MSTAPRNTCTHPEAVNDICSICSSLPGAEDVGTVGDAVVVTSKPVSDTCLVAGCEKPRSSAFWCDEHKRTEVSWQHGSDATPIDAHLRAGLMSLKADHLLAPPAETPKQPTPEQEARAKFYDAAKPTWTKTMQMPATPTVRGVDEDEYLAKLKTEISDQRELCEAVHVRPLMLAVVAAGLTEADTEGPTGGGGIDHAHTIAELGRRAGTGKTEEHEGVTAAVVKVRSKIEERDRAFAARLNAQAACNAVDAAKIELADLVVETAISNTPGRLFGHPFFKTNHIATAGTLSATGLSSEIAALRLLRRALAVQLVEHVPSCTCDSCLVFRETRNYDN